MNVLRTAFEGTKQPLPGSGHVTIWYVEDGFQTLPPPDKRPFYRRASSTSGCSTRSASAAGSRDCSGDGTRKPSYEAFKAAIAEARRRHTDCSKVRGAPTG
jgi:hypothetical protein